MAAPLAAVVIGAVASLFEPLPLQILRHAVFDHYQRWHPRPYQAVPVRVVDVDEDSLKRVGQCPWPRTRIAEMIEQLQQVGAAAIGFDVMLAEPDRTSPTAMLALWDVPGELRGVSESFPITTK